MMYLLLMFLIIGYSSANPYYYNEDEDIRQQEIGRRKEFFNSKLLELQSPEEGKFYIKKNIKTKSEIPKNEQNFAHHYIYQPRMQNVNGFFNLYNRNYKQLNTNNPGYENNQYYNNYETYTRSGDQRGKQSTLYLELTPPEVGPEYSENFERHILLQNPENGFGSLARNERSYTYRNGQNQNSWYGGYGGYGSDSKRDRGMDFGQKEESYFGFNKEQEREHNYLQKGQQPEPESADMGQREEGFSIGQQPQPEGLELEQREEGFSVGQHPEPEGLELGQREEGFSLDQPPPEGLELGQREEGFSIGQQPEPEGLELGQREEGFSLGQPPPEGLELGQREEGFSIGQQPEPEGLELGQREEGFSIGQQSEPEGLELGQREEGFSIGQQPEPEGLELGQREEGFSIGQQSEPEGPELGQREEGLFIGQPPPEGLELGQREEGFSISQQPPEGLELGQREEGFSIGQPPPMGLELGQREEGFSIGQQSEPEGLELGQREEGFLVSQSQQPEGLELGQREEGFSIGQQEEPEGIETGQREEDFSVGQQQELQGLEMGQREESFLLGQQSEPGDLEMSQKEKRFPAEAERQYEEEFSLSQQPENYYEPEVGQTQENVRTPTYGGQHVETGKLEVRQEEESLYGGQQKIIGGLEVGQQEQSLYGGKQLEIGRTEIGQQKENLYGREIETERTKSEQQEEGLSVGQQAETVKVEVGPHEGNLNGVQRTESGTLELGQQEESLYVGQQKETGSSEVGHKEGSIYVAQQAETRGLKEVGKQEISYSGHQSEPGRLGVSQQEESLYAGQLEVTQQEERSYGEPHAENERINVGQEVSLYSEKVETGKSQVGNYQETSINSEAGKNENLNSGQKNETTILKIGQIEEIGQTEESLYEIGQRKEKDEEISLYELGQQMKNDATKETTTVQPSTILYNKEQGQKNGNDWIQLAETETQNWGGLLDVRISGKDKGKENVSKKLKKDITFLGKTGEETTSKSNLEIDHHEVEGKIEKHMHTETCGHDRVKDQRISQNRLTESTGIQSGYEGYGTHSGKYNTNSENGRFKSNSGNVNLQENNKKIVQELFNVQKQLENNGQEHNFYIKDIQEAENKNQQENKQNEPGNTVQVEELGLEDVKNSKQVQTQESVAANQEISLTDINLDELIAESQKEISLLLEKPNKQSETFEKEDEEYYQSPLRNSFSKKHPKHSYGYYNKDRQYINKISDDHVGSLLSPPKYGSHHEGSAGYNIHRGYLTNGYLTDETLQKHLNKRDTIGTAGSEDRHRLIDDFLTELDKDINKNEGTRGQGSSVFSQPGYGDTSRSTYSNSGSSYSSSSHEDTKKDRAWYKKVGDRISSTYQQAKDKAKELASSVKRTVASL